MLATIGAGKPIAEADAEDGAFLRLVMSVGTDRCKGSSWERCLAPCR
jgi:hypothetical protein